MILNLDGKEYQYNPDDVYFIIQVGKGQKGSYKTRYGFELPSMAVRHFNAINIGRGHKKRLVMQNLSTGRNVILARDVS